jgi:hypothetical protein
MVFFGTYPKICVKIDDTVTTMTPAELPKPVFEHYLLYFTNLFVFWDEVEDSERKPLS